MNAMLNTRAMARAGAYTGIVFYLLCVGFYLVAYGGSGDWMFQPFMPGVTNTLAGYVLGLFWAAGYGAAIPWLLAVLYNRTLRTNSMNESA
jgi:hypothetical protein